MPVPAPGCARALVAAVIQTAGRVTVLSHTRRPARIRQSDGQAAGLGMVFMPGGYRRTKTDIGRIVTGLETILSGHPGDNDLATAEAWLSW